MKEKPTVQRDAGAEGEGRGSPLLSLNISPATTPYTELDLASKRTFCLLVSHSLVQVRAPTR
jgi:hypothetical protein